MTHTPAPASVTEPESFDVTCGYCDGIHAARRTETTIHGYRIWDITDCAQTTRYGVTAHSDRRI